MCLGSFAFSLDNLFDIGMVAVVLKLKTTALCKQCYYILNKENILKTGLNKALKCTIKED